MSGVVYVGRCFDKIRLQPQGLLPEPYHANIGRGLDLFLSKFLHLDYAVIAERVRAGGSDEAIWADLVARSPRPPGEFEVQMFNAFLSKRGWCDERTPMIEEYKREHGLEHDARVQCIFDLLDADEGRL